MHAIRKKYMYNHVHDAASLQTILTELAGANKVRVLKDAPAHSAGTAHSVANLVSFLHSMIYGGETNLEYTKSAYGATSTSELSEEERKPCGRDRNKDKQSKSCGKQEKKKKKDNIDTPTKNTCPHCKKFQCRKPHCINPDKCMWNKKYKGYHFKSICDKLEVAFKPRHKFTAELGGYADKEDSESKRLRAGMEDVERKDDTDTWIKIEWRDSYKNKITSLVLTTMNNAFAILSVSNDPTTKQAAPVLVPSPISCKTDNKTIMFDPKEHRRQCKIAWQQHVWQTL
jgi:hypothetical protein